MKDLKKKGNVDAAKIVIMSIVTLGIVLAIGMMVLSEISTAIETSNDASWTTASGTVTASGNATNSLVDALGDTPTWIGILLIVFFASLILSYFYMKGQ